MPGARVSNPIDKFEREDEFELMLAAIEENSGHMIILTTIEWKKLLCIKYDKTKPMHDRLELTHLESHYKINDS